MRTDWRKALPKTTTDATAVCAQWVRCGKPGCRCARGELHGPYHYLFWRSNGRLHKRYVRAADAATARQTAARQRQEARRARETAREGRRVWRALLIGIREFERDERE